MRTTLTIDDDLYARVEQRARREQVSPREVIEALLRRGLDAPARAANYTQPVHASALQPGIDPRRLHQLADDLADEDVAARLRP